MLWLAGALADGSAAPALWLARTRDRLRRPRPSLFWVPGAAAARAETWNVEIAHFAERFQLFIIIALGESIVITGARRPSLASSRHG